MVCGLDQNKVVNKKNPAYILLYFKGKNKVDFFNFCVIIFTKHNFNIQCSFIIWHLHYTNFIVTLFNIAKSSSATMWNCYKYHTVLWVPPEQWKETWLDTHTRKWILCTSIVLLNQHRGREEGPWLWVFTNFISVYHWFKNWLAKFLPF